MTWLELNKIDQRINEIEKIFDDYPDLDDDIFSGDFDQCLSYVINEVNLPLEGDLE